jgi:hypothetical protein
MQLDLPTIASLLRETIVAPRSAARRVLSIAGGFNLALLAVAFVAVLSAGTSVLLSKFAPPTGNPEMDYLMSQPLQLAGMQALGMLIFGAAVTGIGRLFGGKGRFDQTLMLLAWLDFLLLVLQLGLIVLMLALPPLAGLVFLAAMALIVWLLASFIAELHGFASTTSTLAVIIATVLFLGVVLVLISPLI